MEDKVRQSVGDEPDFLHRSIVDIQPHNTINMFATWRWSEELTYDLHHWWIFLSN